MPFVYSIRNMFEKLRLPKKITPSPIAEAIFEIRFASDIPGTALCGIFYPTISTFISGSAIEELPIVQLPPVVRDNDPNLRFQPHYKVAKENFVFAFGPNSISFSCLSPYSGWDEWTKFFFPILEDLEKLDVLKNAKINRLGLRNINKIDGKLLEHTKTVFAIDNTSLAPYKTQIHSEFFENDNLIILNMANDIGQQKKDIISVFDIDCVKNVNAPFVTLKKDIIESGMLDSLHETNKKFFFGLLKEDFLEKMNPEY